MLNLPNKEKFLKNFQLCNNWEEKYLYIIELGKFLKPIPRKFRTSKNILKNCQSKVWIFLIKKKNKIYFYGDSDTSIVKGLIAIIFIIYQSIKPHEIINYDLKPIFKKIKLIQHLTPSRVQGLESMIKNIRIQTAKFF